MADNENIASEPLVTLDESKLLGLNMTLRVGASDAERPVSELSRLLSKIGVGENGRHRG